MFIIEKHINNVEGKYSECKDCNIKRGVKCYFENKDKISVHQKINYEKNRDKQFQKRNDYRIKRNIYFKELHKSYVELQSKLKILDGKSN